jgi:polyhydroxyalkanoate synthesis regulator phasin
MNGFQSRELPSVPSDAKVVEQKGFEPLEQRVEPLEQRVMMLLRKRNQTFVTACHKL